MSTTSSPGPAGQGLMRLAVFGAAVLVLAGGAAFYFASQKAAHITPAEGVTITINDGACQPNALSVPAGRTTFNIVNQSDRAMEREILDGVMVVEERENILPGFTQALSAKLSTGTYEITCGLLTNPRGVLTVTASAASDAEAARPALTAFIGPLAEYQVYLAMQVSALTKQVSALEAAIQAGDVAQAKALYSAARLPYRHIEPMAERFSDLDNVIDPVADYLAQRESDPAFTGFHRIEYGLFAKNSTDGLAPISAKLLTDVTALKERVRALGLTPDALATSAVKLLTGLADTKIASGEDHYAQSDLADFAGNIDGVAKIIGVLKPVAIKAAPDKVADIEAKLAVVQASLQKLQGAGDVSYASVDVAARTTLAEQVRTLAEAIDQLNASVGLE